MKNAYKKLERWYILVMLIMIVIVVNLAVEIFKSVLLEQQEKEINQISAVVTNAIHTSVESEKLIQKFWIEKLEKLSQEIEVDLNGIGVDKVTNESLDRIQSKYALSGVALFERVSDGIVIKQSTSRTEVGINTSTWGFWNEAFLQLFDTGRVSIDQGVSKEKFWAGPRSLAYGQNGFFLFTYYKLEGTPYLLNLYIDDQEAFGVMKQNDPNQLIENIKSKYDYISEIAVINVEAWNNRFTHENRFKLQDFTIHYGQYKTFSAQDTYYLNQVNALKPGEFLFTEFYTASGLYKKVYVKSSNNEAIVMVLDNQSISVFKNKLMYIVIGCIIFVVLLCMYLIRYYTKHYTALLAIENKRLQMAEKFKSTVTLLPSIVFRLRYSNHQITIVHCEGKGLKHLDITPEMCENQLAQEVFPDFYFELIKNHVLSIQSGTIHHFEVQFDSKLYYHHLEKIEDIEGQHSEFLLFANDVTRLRRSEEKAKYLAYHDSLTQLPNRLYFKNEVDRYFDECEPFAVAFVDMDGFKEVNDTAGHDVGDLLITEVSRRLLSTIDKEDFCARMGGDEFALVLKDYSGEKLSRMIVALGQSYSVSGYTFRLTASIGLSRFPEDGEDYTTLLKKADIAMYQVKDEGKNHFKMFQS